MNGLSLRVSSVKTSDNVRKNAEMRAALTQLPTHYQQSVEWFCLDFLAARSVPEQVASVKKIFQRVTDGVKVLQFLCELFVSCPLKHPVRNQIVKLLILAHKTANNEEDVPIVKTLEVSLRNLVKGIALKESSCEQWNTAIASISGCFENFDAGLKSLRQCIDEVFPIICQSIDKYTEKLPTIVSPSVRNEYYMFIHNSIRVLLNCVQEFGDHLKGMPLIQELNTRCQQITLDGDIPMDPRTNAGILMAYISKLNNAYDAFVAHAKDIQNPHEIAICVGVINTCNQQDFICYSSELRDICETIHKVATTNATVPNILLCATRALYQISKLTLNFKCESEQNLKDVLIIVEELLNFSVAFMEHHMDSVRHLCRDIIRNVVVGSRNLNFEEIMLKIYEACNSENLSLAVKCVILQQAAKVVGADEIICNCQTLFSNLFAEHLGKDFIVNNLYEALMLASYKEQPYEKWCSIWIFYLLELASLQDSRLADVEALIVKAVKCNVRVVDTIVCDTNTQQNIPISTKLSTLWAVRKSGIKIDNFPDLMEKLSKHIQLSILSNNDDTRVMALRLLVETNKTTETLTTLECGQIIVYLRYNSNCQSPATRQKSLSMLGKALSRCQVGLMKKMKGKDCNDTIGEMPLELKFLLEFIKVLVDNLFDGANFSRRSVSLQLLDQCLNIGVECKFELMSILPPNALKVLLATLSDSYESNKELALKMLKTIEQNHGDGRSLIQSYQLNINLSDIQSLLTSVKPTDSVTAAYQLEFLCHRCDPKVFVSTAEVPYSSPCLYAALKWLLSELGQGLKSAEQSILEAAKFNPLYGLLFAVNHLLRNLEFSVLAEELLWRNLIADLILLCKQLTHVVAPIVNSSSPEGHLPNDFGELPEELCKGNSCPSKITTSVPCKILTSKLRSKSDMAAVKTTPQMVLICAWRTVKEVSLILGDIVLYSGIQMSMNSQRFLITKEQILEIGEHFKTMLSETKHRGAFEQAYVGFSKLCCRLWTVKCDELNSLPMLWLKDLLELIAKEDINNGKICATRRSAGVPFMMQALITSELKVGTTKALMFCMNRLLELCSSNSTCSESRTHALNILRALFRCTDLNEAVGEYVAEGVMAAIRGYDANNWSEKNSSTLLFAALITRIFGVQLTKDSENLNIRNRMTGRIFFLRYPKLYDFFLEELKMASILIEQQQKANKLHPLLLILSRLYPSALEGTESTLKLSVFIAYITKCGSCPEMQTRYLASKAIVALVNKDEVTNLVLRKCGDAMLLADVWAQTSQNVLHGCLLQIFYLIKHNRTILNEDLVGDISSTIVLLHQRTKLQNAVILKVMLDIFLEILSSSNVGNLKPAVLQQLCYFTSLHILNEPKASFYYTVLRKHVFLYNLYIMLLILPMKEALSDCLIEAAMTNVSQEQLETHLNVVLYILAKAKHIRTYEAMSACQVFVATNDDVLNVLQEEFEILSVEVQFVNALKDDVLLDLSNDLMASKQLYKSLICFLQIPKSYPAAAMKAYAILSFLKEFELTLPQLLQASKKQSDDVKSAITMCVERVLHTQAVCYEYAELCLEYLNEIAHASQPFCLRYKAARSLAHVAMYYPAALEMKHIPFLRLYIQLVLKLLMDDDYDVRDFVGKLILQYLDMDLVLSVSDSHTIVIPGELEGGLVSTVVQLVFVQYTAGLLQKFSNEKEVDDDDFIIEIFKILVNQKEDLQNSVKASSDNTVNVEIFDKNETNDFAEPFTITMDAFRVFKAMFPNRLKVQKFVEDFFIW